MWLYDLLVDFTCTSRLQICQRKCFDIQSLGDIPQFYTLAAYKWMDRFILHTKPDTPTNKFWRTQMALRFNHTLEISPKRAPKSHVTQSLPAEPPVAHLVTLIAILVSTTFISCVFKCDSNVAMDLSRSFNVAIYQRRSSSGMINFVNVGSSAAIQ